MVVYLIDDKQSRYPHEVRFAFSNEADAAAWRRHEYEDSDGAEVVPVVIDPKDALRAIRNPTGEWVVRRGGSASSYFEADYGKELFGGAWPLTEDRGFYRNPEHWPHGLPNFEMPVAGKTTDRRENCPNREFYLCVRADSKQAALDAASPILDPLVRAAVLADLRAFSEVLRGEIAALEGIDG